jgi:AcrR family transcriptional regulator
MTSTRSAPPPRGTRPRNRRDLIRDAAAALFAERGYAQVSLTDVAEVVNVGRSALYRHYPGKAELLYDATDTGLSRVIADLPDSDAGAVETLGALIGNLLENRYAGVLWQREARNLPAAERAALRLKVRTANQLLAGRLAAERPELAAGQADLLASCAVDAVASVSFHRLSLPRAAFEAFLLERCERIIGLDLHPAQEPARKRSDHPAGTRSDELIDAAISLFAEHGYAAVSIDDIGAAVGITGPSVYKHFESKHDLLLEAIVRGTSRMMDDLAAASEASSNLVEKLRQISDAYVGLALDESDLIGVLIGETIHLEPAARSRTRKVQRAVIDDWVALLRACQTDLDPTEARIKVQAAQMVANDIGRTRHLRNVPGFRQIVLDVCWELQQ